MHTCLCSSPNPMHQAALKFAVGVKMGSNCCWPCFASCSLQADAGTVPAYVHRATTLFASFYATCHGINGQADGFLYARKCRSSSHHLTLVPCLHAECSVLMVFTATEYFGCAVPCLSLYDPSAFPIRMRSCNADIRSFATAVAIGTMG